MKAIFTFKKIDGHYKPRDERFVQMAKLSVLSVSRFYKTKLYTDTYGKYFFESRGIKFDEVEILESIDKYKGTLEVMPKIYTLLEQTEPYVHINLETIIFEKIYSPHTITCSYWDLDLNNNPKLDQFESMMYHYQAPWRKYADDLFEELEPKFCRVPNTSFLMVKNPKAITEIYKTILSKFEPHTLDVCDTPQLFENFLPYQFILKNKIDFGFVNDYGSEDIVNKPEGSYKLYNLSDYWAKDYNVVIDELKKISLKFGMKSIYKKTLM